MNRPVITSAVSKLGLTRRARRTVAKALLKVNPYGDAATTQLLYNGATTQLYKDIVATWDQDYFISLFKDHWDPFPRVDAVKYLNLDYWFRRAIVHYKCDHLFSGGGRREVLDIGCGMGYFLAVCRHHGHNVTGVDLDNEPIYNLSVEYLGIHRIVHRIAPDGVLPPFANRFDVVTAYMACFNLLPGGLAWSSENWAHFLPQLHGILNANGSVLIQFNLNPENGELYPADLPAAISAHGGFRAKFYREYLRLDRVG